MDDLITSIEQYECVLSLKRKQGLFVISTWNKCLQYSYTDASSQCCVEEEFIRVRFDNNDG